jgi:uncharacterized protein (UPF0332 family)
VKRFDAYLKEGSVRAQRVNRNLSSAVKRKSQDRLEHAENLFGNAKPKYVLENAYEAIREAIEATLLLAGYKSFSHEATVARLLDLNFTLTETIIVDNLRKQRHGINYYGEDASEKEAEAALRIARKVIDKLSK